MGKCLLPVLLILLQNTSYSQDREIYSYDVTTVQDSVIHLSSLQGKQLLIVNTSLSGSRVNQYAELETLSNLYKDSGLIIIAIPTGAFDSSLINNDQMLRLYNRLQLSYIMSTMMNVKEDNDQGDLYNWLTKKRNNGIMDAPVSGDFYKYLIDSEGRLKGVFSGMVRPLEALLLNALMKY